ncbi:hypothetical protein MASR1M12_22740 [Erysipelotrichia bacterium]
MFGLIVFFVIGVSCVTLFSWHYHNHTAAFRGYPQAFIYSLPRVFDVLKNIVKHAHVKSSVRKRIRLAGNNMVSSKAFLAAKIYGITVYIDANNSFGVCSQNTASGPAANFQNAFAEPL